MSQSATLTAAEFRLDGDLSELPRLCAEVAQFSRGGSLGESVEFNLNLVLEELFANAVSHGGCRGMKGAARVRLEREPDGSVTLEFSDRGRPFDPSAAPPPDLSAPLGERRAGGLGLHFVRSLARILEYRRQDGWNHLKLRLTESV
ncbi:MAG TPA: ATP-binding protein [Bryobacteraceae bacterium]|nr:ATP-binding protein [Bryobacteraceae bacterium]